jgi:hypothetical protein
MVLVERRCVGPGLVLRSCSSPSFLFDIVWPASGVVGIRDPLRFNRYASSSGWPSCQPQHLFSSESPLHSLCSLSCAYPFFLSRTRITRRLTDFGCLSGCIGQFTRHLVLRIHRRPSTATKSRTLGGSRNSRLALFRGSLRGVEVLRNVVQAVRRQVQVRGWR